MATFVTTPQFAKLNVGFALDEGIATPNEVFDVYYCERTTWSKLYYPLKKIFFFLSNQEKTY